MYVLDLKSVVCNVVDYILSEVRPSFRALFFFSLEFFWSLDSCQGLDQNSIRIICLFLIKYYLT